MYTLVNAQDEISPFSTQVLRSMSQIIHLLVVGELQQMARAKADRTDRFQHYLSKTFNKTASLMAHSCRSVALISMAYHGRKFGEGKGMTDEKWHKNVPKLLLTPIQQIGLVWISSNTLSRMHTTMGRMLALPSSWLMTGWTLPRMPRSLGSLPRQT